MTANHTVQPTAGAPPGVVLDTNAVLDGWLFKDPGMAKVVSAIDGYQLHWLATASMRDELAHTLLLPALKRWKPDVAQMLETFDARVRLLPEPVCPPPQRLWCSDNDDQVFIDLALTQRARWLLSKDRALLKLARKARALGVLVTPPARWAAGG